MAFLFQRKTYQVLVPPITKRFSVMEPAEAEAFFQWFLSQKEERVAYLSAHFPHVGYRLLSPHSLVPLWAWFLKQAKTERTPDAVTERHRAEVSQRSPELARDVFRTGQPRLTFETELLLWDIGIYLGETFIKNEPGLYWTHYGPEVREDIFLNKPVLAGFQSTEVDPPFDLYFEPVHMAGVQARKILSGNTDPSDLFRVYKNWATKFVQKPRS